MAFVSFVEFGVFVAAVDSGHKCKEKLKSCYLNDHI